jgi:hypothetical protein
VSTPSTQAQYSLILRVRPANRPGMPGRVATAIGEANGQIGAIDLVQLADGYAVRDVCLDTKDPDEIVAAVKAISPGFGGISLEEISAPRCFEIEDRRHAELDIPVLHDDRPPRAVARAPRGCGPRTRPQLDHAPGRLERDLRGHLRAAGLTVAEHDRQLDDLQPEPQGAVRQLDLEAVAVGTDRAVAELPQPLCAEALEPAREVPDRHAEHGARVPAAEARDEPARRGPVLDAAAVDVARAEDDVGAPAGGVQQPRQVGRVVREVRVHLDDVAGAASERVVEAGHVGRAEAALARPVQHLDLLVPGGEAVRDVAGAVGRRVVDHEDAQALGRGGQRGPHAGHHPLEVRGLVVRRQHHPHRAVHDGSTGSWAGVTRYRQ